MDGCHENIPNLDATQKLPGLQVLCKTGMGMLILVEVLMGIGLRI